MRSRRRKRVGLALSIASAAAIAMLPGAALAGNTTVNVSNAQTGQTLQFVGYNIAHYMPGSNTSAWLDYSGVNAARVWATSSDYEVLHGTRRDDFTPWGDGVTDLASFNNRKAALRNDPLNTAYIDWPEFDNNFQNKVQTGRNKVVLNHVLGELHDRGIHVMQQTTRSAGAYEIVDNNDWAGKWEQWQHYYAMAFHSARHYDVAQWQMYNEPNADANTDTTDYTIRLRLASDAIRSAIGDVNRIYGKSLVADIAAPVTAGGSSRVDDWGRVALQGIRTDYQGQAVGYDIFNTYAAQVYGQTGASFGSEVAGIRSKIPNYHAGGAAAGQAMPVIFSEWNRFTSNNFADRADTLETPFVFTDIGSTFVNAMAQGAKSMYSFKFSQTMWLPDGSTVEEPQKTGFHYVGNSGTYDVTGATRSSGVVRLVAKAFVDERARLAAGTATAINNYDLATSYDPQSDNYYLFGVNRNDAETHTLKFNLNGWGVAPGTMVSVEEVSTGHNGEVVHMVPVGADGTITLNQPSRSVWLLTVPKTADTMLTVGASADARVRNSDGASQEDYSSQNYGSLERARVGRTDTSARLDYATYLRFSVGSTDADDVSRAILQLNGFASNADGGAAGTILFHVYALSNDAWSEGGITWDNAPNLDDFDTKLTGVGTTAFPVGQLTFTGGASQLVGIDLTKFLQDHPELFDDGQLSFALLRETRFANDVDNAGSFVELYTRESAEGLGPQLSLFVVPEPACGGAVLALAGCAASLRRRRRRSHL